jgi:hypothetical protein
MNDMWPYGLLSIVTRRKTKHGFRVTAMLFYILENIPWKIIYFFSKTVHHKKTSGQLHWYVTSSDEYFSIIDDTKKKQKM